MIRLLFIPFFALVLFSCDDSSEKFDPLFYQISEADSARCMDEILEGILEDAHQNQEMENELRRFYGIGYYCDVKMQLEITINSKEEIHVNIGEDSLSIQENIFKYYTFNRKLTATEIASAASNRYSHHFEFPFFNSFGLEEIERKIDETNYDFEEVRETEGAQKEYIDYLASKVEEWKKRKWILEFLRIDELPELDSYVRMTVEYSGTSKTFEEVLDQVAFAFYQLRNYYSLMYFNETYLSLYERTKRTNSKNDLDRMQAIEMLQPITFFNVDLSKPSPFWELAPEPQTELK